VPSEFFCVWKNRSTGSQLWILVILVTCFGMSGPPAWSQSPRQAANMAAVRGLAEVDSLLAVPDRIQAVAAARDLWHRMGEHPVYGWQIEGRLGLALLVAAEPEAALPHLENVVRRQPREAIHHRNLGAALLQLKRRGRALSEYQMAVELAPGSADLRREFGQVLLSFGNTKGAARELAVAHDLCGGCPELDQPLAALYLMQKDFARAVPLLQRLYDRDPSPEGHRNLMAAMARAGEDSAVVAFVTAVPVEQRSNDEWRLLVEAEGRLGGRTCSLAAVALLSAAGPAVAVLAQVGAAPFWGQVSLNLLAAAEYENGLTAVDQAIALAPENVVYRNNRVVLLTRLGRDTEARAEWERVLALDPTRTQDTR